MSQASDAYYGDKESILSDEQYDLLLEELSRLEAEYPELQVASSPTLQVGAAANFAPTQHPTRMYSLENCYKEEELYKWFDDVAQTLREEFELTEPPTYIAELKIDGLAMSFIYKKGQFIQAVTRGDGVTGDDVTGNVARIAGLPMELSEPMDLELRGEVYLAESRFEEIQEELAAAGQDGFMNARNAAAGSIRLKDSQMVARRGLSAWVYDWVGSTALPSHIAGLERLQGLGFPINQHHRISQDPDEIYAFCKQWEAARKDLDYDIDGVVIKLNEQALRQRLGFTAKFPRWAKAWKFKGERATSRLLRVEDSIGRTGVLTPVAHIDPVHLHGTLVQKASLHNYSQIEMLDLRIGDAVWVEKGGEIIPKIVGVDLEQRPPGAEPLLPPPTCPSCEEPLVRQEGEVDLRCLNSRCPAQRQAKLEHFVSRKAMDIEGLGPRQIATFLAQGWIQGIPDLYRLAQRREEMKLVEGFGEKSVEKLLESLEASKVKDLGRFLFALGIRHIGEKLAKNIAMEAGDLKGLMKLNEAQLSQLAEVDKAVKESFLNWMGESENPKMIEELMELGLRPTPLERPQSAPFAGKNLVITGTLSIPRGEWKYRLEAQGFNVVAQISKKTHYLLAGEKAGSKLKKATELGVKILDEQAMEQLIEKGDS